MLKNLFNRLEDIYPELVELRRDFHMYPELSHEEVNTPKKIAAYLKELGIEVRTEVGGRGVVGTLKGGKHGKTVALRADFDALPIEEETDLPYKSRVPGVMHACGHDLHTAALLGVAKVLSEHRDEIPGTIKFIHQFAEEATPGGAKPMIEDGCLEGVDVIYGAHVMSTEEFGTVSVKDGYFSSAQDDFNITIRGKGGHGSQPHLTVDPLVTGSQLVVNLQQIVSRRVDPQQAAAVTVGSFVSGGANNIIPDSATIKGTVRTFDEEARQVIEEALENVTRLTCAQNGAEVDFEYIKDCPSIYNDPEETKVVEDVAKGLFGEENLFTGAPMMGSEDFAFYTKEIPAVYFTVGGRSEELNAVYPHHHPKFNVDERAIINIGKMFLSLVTK
ncbi:M20 metallopeptidase family protein [Ornithinibacillus halophilus]|uniref:Amidohydrolase n=1 Tax=Ornithinibacillus halophilus TaxID=930117 RepID=A0A1M5K326_9BACI|nr:M20 family metallopeptidase [Ornithinibacillus halophilus]SHG47212.1 amidohydrolase [Ornithinibacillus halophilus]